MQIEIETGEGVEYTAELEEHAEEKLRRIERRFGQRLTRIIIFLKDERPGKGGIDKSCNMEARPAGRDPIAVEALEATTFEAITAAADKLERALARRLDRKP